VWPGPSLRSIGSASSVSERHRTTRGLPLGADPPGGLLRGLNELGYVYGKDFVTESRGSGGRPERFPTLATELIRLQVDVILAPGPALTALKQAASSIPVIMTATLDPVGQGFIQSLGHPGGNFTGFSLQSPETVGKRLEVLKDLVPGSAPLAVLWDQPSIIDWQAAQAAARERGWKVLSMELRDVGEIEDVFRTAVRVRAGARSSWTRSSRAPSPLISLLNSRRSSSWSSTLRPLRRSG
jgi:ABC-type uncharacterized transport system substrate-binding protein